jgi:transposase
MSHKATTHLKGERGQAFAEQIRNIPPERILCVSLDIGKYFHVVMIHTAWGEIVTPTFEIDIFQTGFTNLCAAIDDAAARCRAKVVLTGMEPTGHYFENLARHLRARSQPVTLINSYAVKENRSQQMMRREKTDEIDVAAVGDLLRRGEGTLYRPASGLYLQLQHLDRVRIAKLKMQTMLKNQILGHLDRIFPGLVLQGQEAMDRYRPLFTTSFWQCQTLQHLVRVCPEPGRLATLSPRDLVALFHDQHYRLGPQSAAKIIAYAQKTLLPEAELSAIRSDLLHADLTLLEHLQLQIDHLEQRLGDLLAQVPAAAWAKLKGLSTVQVASLVAAMGDPSHYTRAAQIFRRAGLVSGRNDSGRRQRKGKGQGVLKVGDVYLRRAVMVATETLILHQPVLRQYYTTLKKTKHPGVARVATARKALGILWATLRDQRSTTLLLKKGPTM